jgi:hypothetical protein
VDRTLVSDLKQSLPLRLGKGASEGNLSLDSIDHAFRVLALGSILLVDAGMS